MTSNSMGQVVRRWQRACEHIHAVCDSPEVYEELKIYADEIHKAIETRSATDATRILDRLARLVDELGHSDTECEIPQAVRNDMWTDKFANERGHRLMTNTIGKTIPPLRSQENNPDPIVHLRLFCPWAPWTWHITEWDSETGECFGFERGDAGEGLTYISLEQLSELRINQRNGILGIERDMAFTPRPLSEATRAPVPREDASV